MSFFKFPVYDIPSDIQHPPDQEIKSIAIILHKDHYGDQEQALLQKIIAATGTTTDNIDIVKCDNEIVYYPGKADGTRGLIISFGITPANLGLQTDPTPYRLIKIGQRSFLFSDHLSSLKKNGEMKKALWANLKLYFEL